MKYLVSLKHTGVKDEVFTLWRPNNQGYCISLNMAGLYDNLEKGYHDSEETIPVESDILERMAFTVEIDYELKSFVPVNKFTLKELGLKVTRKGIVKIK